jgi:transcription elongation factor Elf1
MFTWIGKLFSLVENKFSCPHCKDITWTNICARACIPWMNIQCSKCGKDISCSKVRGFLQIILSIISMYIASVTFPHSEIGYAIATIKNKAKS